MQLDDFTRAMIREAREIERTPWLFGRAMVDQELQEKVLEGVRAMATLWFLEFTDEDQLPRHLVDLMEEFEHWSVVDFGDLEDEEEDEEEEAGV